MRCQVCQAENKQKAHFCVNCGAAFELRCPNCGNIHEVGQNFCGNCGWDLRRRSAFEDASPASYTPQHLAKRILEERHLIVGERKHVTVLFADIVDSTATIEHVDPEEAASYLTDSLGAMMDAIHRYEGTVNELRGDGIMALFGAPIAHEDHAIRACRAALAIPDAVAAATGGKARIRVGLHTGEVLVREVGNDLAVEYQALGPTVHLAARMETLAAPGTAYITDDVRRLIEGAVAYRTVGSRQVKGVSAPVDVFELTAATDATPWQARAAKGLSHFTGRDNEIARLYGVLSEVTPERGRAVAIVGEAGIGKSRLVHEFLASPHLAAFQVVKAEASPFDVNTAYYPVKHAIYHWLGTQPGDPELPRRLHAALGELDAGLESVAPALAVLLDAPLADSTWSSLSPGDRRRRTRDAVVALVRASAESRQMLLVVEDLHWIDSETQTILDDLVDLAATAPLCMVVTHRPEYVDAWAAKPHVRRVNLGALESRATIELLDHLLGDDPTVSDLKPMIATRSEGTPLFLEEIVRALVDAGSLTGTPGNYRASIRERELQIPDSVQAVLAARIDTLDPTDKHVLQVAAVAGATAELPLLTGAIDWPQSDVVAALRRLQSRDFVFEAKVLPVSVYRFGHALMRDVAYGSLPIAQRRSLHTAMVATLEEAGVGANDAPVERLAFHAARGELGQKAVGYCSQAADRAIDRSAFREAAVFLRDALGVLNGMEQDKHVIETGIDLRMKMRVAVTGATGGLKRSLVDLAEAQRMARSIDDIPRQGLLAIHYGYTANMLGNVALAEEQSHIAERLGRSLGDRWLEIEGRVLRAQTFNYAGQPNRVPELIKDDFDYLSTELRHDTRGQTMIRAVVAGAHLAVAESAMGNFDEATPYEDEATAIAAETGRPFDLMYMHYTSGMRLDFQGRASAAVAAHRRSVAIAEEHDLWFMTTFAQPWLGHALVMDGRAAEALELLRRIEASAQRVELPYVEALSQAFAAQATQRLGDEGASRAYAALALDFNSRFPNPVIELAARTALGILRKDSDEGLSELHKAAALAQKYGFRPWLASLQLELADAQPRGE
jgi:class 3 adenylate cyclase/ABC-type nitrate/sulfonate/bicarbonate transport system ATPase subunit/tetratricopeptide (TPR) repeat protein